MQDNDGVPAERKGRVEIRIEMHREDAERFLKAFTEGKLADLGVVGVKLEAEMTSAPGNKRWAIDEGAKGPKPPDERTAPDRP